LKEYGELLGTGGARDFSGRVRDVTEFLASIELNPHIGALKATATYQDSCHLAHGQRIRTAPRKLLAAVPGLTVHEMRGADLCCGSAGIYNITQNEMSMRLLAEKMEAVNAAGAEIIATANPGCILQLRAGVRMHGKKQRVMHVVEVLDEAYSNG
jgi:glycolate oxidase iron-sulfur subunit